MHSKCSLDHNTGLQKFHFQPTLRIGGLAIISSCWLLAMYGISQHFLWAIVFLKILTPSTVVFMIGFSEDIIKNLLPVTRLVLLISACLFGIYIVQAIDIVTHTNIDIVDYLVSFKPIAIIVTILLLIGITNAFNIIDGYHGLCIWTFLSSMATTFIIAQQLGYHYLDNSILILCGAAIGFAIWNYPSGKIFLGDGGAYFIGFIQALILLELSQKAPNYTPVTSLLITIYPISETLLAIYRKKFLRNMSPFKPDRLHMHMIIYQRLLSISNRRNANVILKMWWLILPQLLVAILFYDNFVIIISACCIYITYYFYIYFRIIRFNTPNILRSSKCTSSARY